MISKNILSQFSAFKIPICIIVYICVCVHYLNCLQEYPLNPKALTLGELYGEYNASTQEWKDGVLSSLMRLVCSGCQH